MHDDAGLWEELEKLYASAGGEPASFRRLERGAGRAGDDLRAYYREVARDYVERLERRLSRPGARLTEQECDLLRAWLGAPSFDERAERRLVEELDGLRAAFERLRALRSSPLSPDAIQAATQLLEEVARRSGAIAAALEAKEQARAFDDTLSNRDALLGRVRAVLLGEDAAAEE